MMRCKICKNEYIVDKDIYHCEKCLISTKEPNKKPRWDDYLFVGMLKTHLFVGFLIVFAGLLLLAPNLPAFFFTAMLYGSLLWTFKQKSDEIFELQEEAIELLEEEYRNLIDGVYDGDR